jgi:hypothetical protein
MGMTTRRTRVRDNTVYLRVVAQPPLGGAAQKRPTGVGLLPQKANVLLRIREGITFTFDERATTDASRRPYIRIYDDKQAIIVGAGLRARPYEADHAKPQRAQFAKQW